MPQVITKFTSIYHAHVGSTSKTAGISESTSVIRGMQRIMRGCL